MNRIDVTEFSRKDLQKAMAEGAESKIRSLDEVSDELTKHIHNPDGITGLTMPWSKSHHLIRFKPGTCSLLVGTSGHRKTTVALQILLNMAKEVKVGIASFEMSMMELGEILTYQAAAAREGKPADFYIKRFTAWSRDRLYVFDHKGSVKPLLALGIVHAMAQQGCKVICLDSLMMMGINNDLDAEREFVQELTALARALDIHIMLIHHTLEKRLENSDQVPTRAMIRGNGQVVDAMSLVLIVWMNKKKSNLLQKQQEYSVGLTDSEQEYVDKYACQKLVCVKNRFLPFEGEINLYSHASRNLTSNRDGRVNPIV